MTKVALLGAGGKMGCRITDNLKKTTYEVRHVEISERGKLALAARGVSTVKMEEALDGASIVILALPDHRIGSVTSSIERLLQTGTMLIALDIAAPLAGVLPKREDLHYFVTHPCHPSIFGFDTDLQAQRDFFGGQHARQNIVCCLFQGPESAYALGEQVARAIYAPVEKVHRCSAEQMAILEPVLSETVLGTCLTTIREALDESVRRGVPPEAARDFLLGHLKVELAIVFEFFEDAVFSDGARKAIEEAKRILFKPDWKRVFDPDAIMQSIRRIAEDS
jgi:hypothetical protein